MKRNVTWQFAILMTVLGAGLASAMLDASAQKGEPRFSQLTMLQLDDRQRPLAEHIMSFSRVGIGGPYNLILRSPPAAKPMLDLLDYLRFHTSVPIRLNEFAILIQGRMWRSQVEWYGHYAAAIKAGVSDKTLADLKANRRPESMQPDEAAVYDFCQELFGKHMVSDRTYNRLRQFLDEQQVIDLTLVSGTYVSIAALMAMGQQSLPPGIDPPFKPREP
jgi:4-carboxymuconolactone decarboxylase